MPPSYISRFNMKKFLIKFLVFAIMLGAIFIPVNMILDPYNIFHWQEPRDNGVEPNKNFIKTKYVISNPDKFDSFLFGSSRAGFMDIELLNQLTGDRWYDMASSEAVVKEHTHTLEALIKKGIIPKNVMVMVDDISCFVDPALHENMLYRVPYPSNGPISVIEFYVKYCDFLTSYESLSVIKQHVSEDKDYLYRYQNTGTERLDKESYFDPDLPQFQTGYWADYYSYRVDQALLDMKELKSLCEKHKINLIVATNPLYYLTYERDIENGYLDYIKGLSEITDFYNFSSLSDITLDYCNFYETSHFTPDVGRMVIKTTQGMQNDEKLQSQGFGIYVTKDNIDELMNILYTQARAKGVRIYE